MEISMDTEIDAVKLVEDYLKRARWEIRENANLPYSFSSIFFRLAGEATAKYTLSEVYPEPISKAHQEGDFHIHNLYMGIVGYCAGWSLRQLLHEGFNEVPGQTESRAPRHLDTALLQMSNFMGTIQQEWAGAQAFNSVDTYLAPFVRRDELDYRSVKQAIQTFVYNMNIASRWGGQTPFTNITLDWFVPEDLKNEPVTIGGKLLDETYGEYQDEVDMINRAFLDVYSEGDMRGRPFTFPIPTYNLTTEFDWDSENANLLFEMAAKYGLPYFANFINSDLEESDIRSMCCRLQLDLRELRRNITGGLFGSADLVGSVGVVTMNMPRLGYLSKDEDEFLERLKGLMDLAKESLEIKREIVQKNMYEGLMPYSKRYLDTLQNHFSTIGLIGMNEACINLLDDDITAARSKDFAARVLKFMLERLREYQEETGNLYNLEATPGEGCSYRLARLDKEKYPDIVAAGEKEPYYTNSTQLPVNKTTDVIYAIEQQEDLQKLYTGGTVLHIFLGEPMASGEACKRLVRKIMENTGMPYITITPTYSICPDHGYISGENPKCPTCGRETEVYSRVVGYYRPTQNWNPGKQEEFKQRTEYDEKTALEKEFERK
ncbi:ribonucleoside-triphosphate reductase [candidate division MSBL1 archaeon SCGC-AAA261O19]|uniref:Ribonucleoside-triphosphate reductase n=1 Tax=candidate division MSBL1 archaeon SCGC-AAA261O19 TaxID=1698277 RepID=A0A133VF74_9EURY|nr:ribonucleoside-triphosphate reductase [candidate division MSBL1 archaeon SCGC-AAA261O19]